jgi:hypothetical protein
MAMATKAEKKLENLVEQKVLEFLGDPDNGLSLKKSFVAKLKKNMAQKNRRYVSHADVLKRYGLR